MTIYYFQCQLSFYVFDWDGTNTINDDFLGSAVYNMTEVKCIKRQFILYNAVPSFNDPQKKALITFREKEKMLVTSIFSFSHNVF